MRGQWIDRLLHMQHQFNIGLRQVAAEEFVGGVGEIVIHLSEQNPRYQAALAQLGVVFATGTYRERPLRYRPHPVLLGGHPIGDIHSEAATDAVLNTCHQLLQPPGNCRRLPAWIIAGCARSSRTSSAMSVPSGSLSLRRFTQHGIRINSEKVPK